MCSGHLGSASRIMQYPYPFIKLSRLSCKPATEPGVGQRPGPGQGIKQGKGNGDGLGNR